MLWQEYFPDSSWNTVSGLFGIITIALIAAIRVQYTGRKPQPHAEIVSPSLPFDVVHQVAQYLSVKDLLRLRAVSRHFLHALNERSIWSQVMKDILATTPIPYLQVSLPSMSTDQIVRACATVYRFHQYLSTPDRVVPVSTVHDTQIDQTDIVGFLPGGSYFVMQNHPKTLMIVSVEDPDSRMLLYSTAGTKQVPFLLATHCISSYTYRMVLYIFADVLHRAKMLLVECNPTSCTLDVIESKELEYAEHAYASYIDDKYWAYLTHGIRSYVVRILDLASGNFAYFHLAGMRKGSVTQTLRVDGNFFVYGTSDNVWVYTMPPINGKNTELIDVLPVWKQPMDSQAGCDLFQSPLLCSQPLLGSPPAFAVWRGEQLMLFQQDSKDKSRVVVREHLRVMPEQVYPSIQSDTRSTTGVGLTTFAPVRELNLYRVSFHDRSVPSPGMVRLDQDLSQPSFILRKNVDSSWAPPKTEWLLYKERIFFDEASARFLVVFKAANTPLGTRPILRVMVLSLVP